MSLISSVLHAFAIRGVCKSIQAQSGDGCYSLAQRCGISQSTFISHNPSPFSCNIIEVGDFVCCSAGTLPDLSPQKQSNGDCTSYTVNSGDTCSSIATSHHIKDWQTLEKVNKETWAWGGCSLIQPGQHICLSSGKPPFPSAVKNAVCGPQVRTVSTCMRLRLTMMPKGSRYQKSERHIIEQLGRPESLSTKGLLRCVGPVWHHR